MIRSLPLPVHRFAGALALAAAASCWSSASAAQMAAAAPAEPVRLTDAQRAEILDGATEHSAAVARGELTGAGRVDRGIHGEIGAMIGTNGTRGAYGAAEIPLGDNSSAAVSFESSRFGYKR